MDCFTDLQFRYIGRKNPTHDRLMQPRPFSYSYSTTNAINQFRFSDIKSDLVNRHSNIEERMELR